MKKNLSKKKEKINPASPVYSTRGAINQAAVPHKCLITAMNSGKIIPQMTQIQSYLVNIFLYRISYTNFI